MKNMMLTAILAVLACLPAVADDMERLGTFHPAVNAGFNGGLTERNNAIGFTAGGHVGLLRLGALRFPTLGVDAGLINKCPPDGYDDRGCRATFAAQLAGGAEVVVNRNAEGEHAFGVALTRIVVGPLAGREGRGLKFFYSFRSR